MKTKLLTLVTAILFAGNIMATELLSIDFTSGQGDWTISNVELSGLNYVWIQNNTYGMKASGYYNKTNNATESWLISPTIDLSNMETATMAFSHAVNYASPSGLLSVKASADGDEWSDLEVSNWPAGNNWTFVDAEASLNDFVGESAVQIAFVYTSSSSAAATWEIKTVSVEGEPSENPDVDPGEVSYEHVKIGDLYYNLYNDEKEAYVIWQEESSNNYSDLTIVNIPSSVTYVSETYHVTYIEEGAFKSCSSLVSVTIPNSVEVIGPWAFCNCNNLTSVNIPNKVERIYIGTFDGCSSLTSVTINSNDIVSPECSSSSNISDYFGKQVTSYIIGEGVTSIGEWAFSNCSSLTSVTIGNSVTSIGDNAFYGCSGLTSVTLNSDLFVSYSSIENIFGAQVKECILGEGVINIRESAFINCSTLTSLAIGNSVTNIGDSAFYNCSSLESVTIGNSITSIGDVVFKGCSSLPIIDNIRYADTYLVEAVNKNLSSYNISEKTKYIGTEAFSNCSSLTSVTIPNSVTYIGSSAFYNCSSLTSMTIPNSVTSIGEGAFSKCSSLTSIELPNSVTSIGSYVFAGCSGLTSMTIPNSVTSIGEYAFAGCSGLTSMTIPTSVEAIGPWAFNNCSNLVSVTIPNSVISIGAFAFNNCSSLVSVTIPNSVISIGASAFNNCSSLTSVTIGNSVSNIGDYAFKSCSSLTSVTIGNSVTNIGESAFVECSSLTSVTINSNAIVSKEYSDSSNIRHIFGNQVTSYIIGEGISSIGDMAFAFCRNMTSITIPNSVSNIGYGAFDYCSSITSVTIPNSVTSIGGYAFRWCSSLTKVNISDIHAWCNISFENLYSNPLSFAEHLYLNDIEVNDLVIPDDVTSIKDYAFYNCSDLTSVSIPNSVTRIGEDVFKDCTNLISVTLNSNAITSKNYDVISTMKDIFGLQVEEYILGEEVTSIGDFAFYECSDLTSVTIPNSVTSIGDCAFCLCSSLTNVTIPNSVKSIGNKAFWRCSSLTSPKYNTHVFAFMPSTYSGEYTILDSIESIAGAAFHGCSSLTSVAIGKSVTSIGDEAFYDCSSLSSIEIPNSVTRIGASAFNNCSSLTSVAIGKSVTSIGEYAFSECSSLGTITCEAVIPPVLEERVFWYVDKSIPLYVPAESVSAYKVAEQWSEFNNIVAIGGTTETYTITFLNYDGTVLQVLTEVEEGEIPVYTGETPTRPDDSQYTYTFIGWTPEITEATADATYTATYDEYELTALPNIEQMSQSTKIIEDGQLFILRDGKTYTVQGKEVR